MKENLKNKSMMLVIQEHNGFPTFSMIRATEDCPYVECIFLPEEKHLAIISTIQKDTFHLLPKLDDNGDVVNTKVIRKLNNKSYKEERKQLKTFYEYNIINVEDIINLVDTFAINSESFPYKEFFK